MATASEVWVGLNRPSNGYSARQHPANPAIWLALDTHGRRHLLVKAPAAEPGIQLLQTKGLRAATRTWTLEDEPEAVWADIECSNSALNDVFLVVAGDLVNEVGEEPSSALSAVRRTLRTWRMFWTVDRSTLDSDAALGLFGELWFLSQWCVLPEAVAAWSGPLAVRHDFVSPAVSVEVKTARSGRGGAGRHRISGLEQLAAPETGQLYLFSLQVQEDQNAGNSLSSLIENLMNTLEGQPDFLLMFTDLLATAGWSPAFAEQHASTYRISSQVLYRVDGTFPRLTRESFVEGLSNGIESVGYTLDLAACHPWVQASSPVTAQPIVSLLGAQS